MSIRHGAVTLIGAGPTGTLLALLLEHRGIDVTVYEARPDPRGAAGDSGRSINLALADRGIHALKAAGVFDEIAHLMMPMRGRFIHPRQGGGALQLYGQRESEVIYSISRHRLNQALLDVALRRPRVRVHFEHRLESIDAGRGIATLHDVRKGTRTEATARPLLATDGAGSVVRHALAAARLITTEEVELDHGYKELAIPAGTGGTHRLAKDALHIWPRGSFMLIALPNGDGSFTATLFLPRRGAVSFETLNTPKRIEQFLSTEFPDVRGLMPGCVAEFQANPTGFLGTVHASPWYAAGIALVGDSAHAIVPFHGQGMNCCFEDCIALDDCLDRHAGWDAALQEFYAVRKPNTDAIAAMALENYLEMRERVVDPDFQLQQALALELERRHPQRFIPRYSMVMFHHEISYSMAQERGALQSRLLTELTAGATQLAQIDFERAATEISRDLAPLPPIAPG